LSLSWRERLQRAKKRLMEQLGLSQEDWDFIWDNIGAFCSKSDEQVREVLESEGRPLTQEEVDKLVETMYQDEFDEMCRDIIIEVFENFGYEIKKKQKQKKKQSKKEEEETEETDSDSNTDSDQDSENVEEQEQEVEVENK